VRRKNMIHHDSSWLKQSYCRVSLNYSTNQSQVKIITKAQTKQVLSLVFSCLEVYYKWLYSRLSATRCSSRSHQVHLLQTCRSELPSWHMGDSSMQHSEHWTHPISLIQIVRRTLYTIELNMHLYNFSWKWWEVYLSPADLLWLG